MQKSNLDQPLDDYDVEGWRQFYLRNPGFHRSVGADGDGEGDGDGDGSGGDGDGSGGSGGDGDGSTGGDPGAWREPYLEGLEGDDLDKEKKYLNRFTTAADYHTAHREQRRVISAGEVLKPLPDGATEDDIKAFREQQGIPLEVAGYFEKLPEGLVIGDEDKEIMEDFAGALHDVNASPSVVHAAVGWYNKFMEKADADRAEEDEKVKGALEDELREEWGKDYRGNINRLESFVTTQFNEETAELFRNARLADGTPVLSNASIVRGLVAVSRELNPGAHLVSGGDDPGKSIDDAIAEIEKVMKEDRARYNKDETMQKRLRDLYQAREDRKQKGKAA